MAGRADTDGGLPRPDTRRKRRRRRLIVTLVVAPFVAHFVYTRLTVMPPGLGRPIDERLALAVPPPGADRTADLLAALDALPPLPTLTGPPRPPAGWKWRDLATDRPLSGRTGSVLSAAVNQGTAVPGLGNLNPWAALCGEWSPDTRYHQGQVVAFLDSAPVREALDAIVRLSGEPACLSPIDRSLESKLLLIGQLLAARARCRLAGQGDLQSAANDVLAVLRLAEGIADDQTSRRATLASWLANVALEEIAHWGHECSLDPAKAGGFMRQLRERTPDLPRRWAAAMRGNCVLAQAAADQCYTRKASGNGWYVLYRGEGDRSGDWLLYGLNLFSPFFDDRKTVLRTCSVQYEAALAAGSLPPEHAYQSLQRIDRTVGRATDPGYTSQELAQSYRFQLDTLLMHRAAITCVALSMYRHDRGRYPESLGELVPSYVSEFPLDPLTGQPFDLRRLGDLRFRLTRNMPSSQAGGWKIQQFLNVIELPTPRRLTEESGRLPGSALELILVPASTPDPGPPPPSPPGFAPARGPRGLGDY